MSMGKIKQQKYFCGSFLSLQNHRSEKSKSRFDLSRFVAEAKHIIDRGKMSCQNLMRHKFSNIFVFIQVISDPQQYTLQGHKYRTNLQKRKFSYDSGKDISRTFKTLCITDNI